MAPRLVSAGSNSGFTKDDRMPIYQYGCVDCRAVDQRVAGIDDHAAICAQCSGLMLRLDEDVFKPYFDNQEKLSTVIVNGHQHTPTATRTGAPKWPPRR